MASLTEQSMPLLERARAAQPAVTRWLVGRPLPSPEGELRGLADVVGSLAEATVWDRYGARGPVDLLERRLADQLGKPAVESTTWHAPSSADRRRAPDGIRERRGSGHPGIASAPNRCLGRVGS